MEVYWTGISQPPNSINFPPARWCAAYNGVRFKSMRNSTPQGARGQGGFDLLSLSVREQRLADSYKRKAGSTRCLLSVLFCPRLCLSL
jgi:hypothetical protein